MISHTFLGVGDFDRAFRFYEAVLGELGLVLRFREDERPNKHSKQRSWAGWVRPGASRPQFQIGHPFDEQAPAPGNGPMVALLAPDRPTVARAWQAALNHGGTDEGAPGLRPEYHAHYYGAYFRDLDGNKLCVCCHDAVVEE
ncbi:VOC family protein [Labrys sp. KNU-23]|uniref:VOC family protein n=1 Tax=Labrys sp. KNU-23 TaxID=2789216 RepID=UPI0011EE7062|nr:VOC family protein [Labrys sp. KNU-23]QEN88144.1 VOC family protein [Labrys sp. KNU-23]